VSYYAGDPRILSIVVFGSLGRGNWDRYSDLDLDIISADDITIDIMQELSQLCESFTAIDEHAALIIPNGEDAGGYRTRIIAGTLDPLSPTSDNQPKHCQQYASLIRASRQ